jgi:endonuclease/exonuclease/phosphatase family metal-dependent hydrolase
MRVATWNLLHGLDVRTGLVDLDAVAAAIDALDVSVVAVQEVDRGQERSGHVDQVAELAAKLGWHGVFAPALLGDPNGSWRPGPGAAADPGGQAYGIGLLSRHALHAVARHPLPGAEGRGRRWDREPRVLLQAAVGTSGLVVTTTHLSYLPWRGLPQLRVALRCAAAAGQASVLMGDLNLPRRLVACGLGAAWSADHIAATYPSWRPRLALDHILGRCGLVRDVQVGPLGPSDHLPVVGRVDWP